MNRAFPVCFAGVSLWQCPTSFRSTPYEKQTNLHIVGSGPQLRDRIIRIAALPAILVNR